MGILNLYMKKRDLNPVLQRKVRKYFEYLLNEELDESEKGA